MKFIQKIPSDFKITLIYIIIGALWILFSDQLLHSLVLDNEKANKYEIYKGWFFVGVTGILLFFLIRSELKRRNQILKELKISKLKAEESDKLKSAFLSNISHYLRTPMNSILGFVDLLQNRNLDPKKQERFLSVVNEQSNYLLLFINNIIEISKLQNGQATVNVKSFSMNDLLRKLQLRYQTELEYLKKSSSVKLNGFYHREDVIFTSDAEKIEYILTNLLTNALKFTTSGEINFGYTVKGSLAEFYVSDTGSGIPPEKHELIIKTFMLSDPDINQENIGLGLGLAITNGLVKILNGRLWLEKSSDNGTEFRFELPVKLDLIITESI